MLSFVVLDSEMTMLPPDPIYIFKGEMVSVACVAFRVTELSQRIFAGTQSGRVHVWNLKTKREVSTFKAGDDVCLSICIPQEEDAIITHVKSGDVSFWTEDDSHWALKKLIKTDFFGFCKCQIFGDVLYAPVKNSKCELISLKTREPFETVDLSGEKSGDVMAFKVFAANGRTFMIVAYEGLKLGLWDVKESKEASRLQLEECPMAVDYDPVTNKGLCGDPTNKILIFSLDESFHLKPGRRVTLTNAGVAAVRIRPDGKVVAVGCWDGKLRLYSWKSLVLLAVLDIHSATVQDVSFSENYKEGVRTKHLLAAGSQDSRISLWDLYN